MHLAHSGCHSGGWGPPVPGALSALRASDPGKAGLCLLSGVRALGNPCGECWCSRFRRGAACCGAQRPHGHVVTKCPDQDQSRTGPCSRVASPIQPPSVHAVGVPRLPPLVLLCAPRVPGRIAASSVRPGRLAVLSGASCAVTMAWAVAPGVGSSVCSSRSHGPCGEWVSLSWAALNFLMRSEVTGLEGLERAELS